MATSLPLPFRSVGSYLHGHALVSSQAALSCPDLVLQADHDAAPGVVERGGAVDDQLVPVGQLGESVTPHLSVTLAYLVSPLSLRRS